MRLDALLARLGYGSRSEVREIIRRGKVSINGSTLSDPAFNYTNGEVILSGKPIDLRTERTIMLNKPGGLLTAASDPSAPTVFSVLPQSFQSLHCMPVGRLDKDTEGLLLFTTDGELSHRLLAPQRNIRKVYFARTDTPFQERDVERFRQGIELSDFVARPAELEILKPNEARITVTEGKFHQVKRMLAATGHETIYLKRTDFGPVHLDEDLPIGQFRDLREEELDALYRAAGMR